MSARLQSILADAVVDLDVQDKLAQAGLITMGLFVAMGEDNKSVKEFLADVIELDPAGIVTSSDVETKANAERSVAQLLILATSEEFTAVRNAFEKAEYKLSGEVAFQQAVL